MTGYKVHCLSEVVSPLTHMSGTAGNEALVYRQPVVTATGLRWVPALSGNAIRHRLVRDPGALWLIETLGLAGRLSLLQLNFLLHGGNLTDSTGREDTRRIADMQSLFPFLRLLGGSLPDQILAGSLQCWIGRLVCAENAGQLPQDCPPQSLPDVLFRPAEHFVTGYQYTRGDARKVRAGLLDPFELDQPADSNLMIYGGQSVAPGAVFLHGFAVEGSELELGCLFHCLARWQAAGGTIGGQANKGHGRLRTRLVSDSPLSVNELIERYTAHVEANRGDCVKWLEGVFARKTEKKKGKAAKTEAPAVSDG